LPANKGFISVKFGMVRTL